MNELYDKLILRIVFTLLVCGVIFIYRQAHLVLYPSIKHQLLKKFFPSKNSTDTIHLFARIIGLGIIFSNFQINLSNGFTMALLGVVIESLLLIVFYIGSIYIIESIVLYNFEYTDEILKRKNYAYAIICLSHSIGMAFLINIILKVSNNSLLIIFFLWLLSMVLVGFGSKLYPIISKLSFNRLLVQKNIAVSLSYMGFIWGQCLVISSALDHIMIDIKLYSIEAILKILLSIIIIPIFRKGLILIFKIQDELEINAKNSDKPVSGNDVELGYGIYEGSIIFTACYLTTIITSHITYGNFYPTY